MEDSGSRMKMMKN